MAETQPTTMRAWQYTSVSGGLEKTLHINPTAALPKPKLTQHLVRILATALNPVDYKVAEIPYIGRLLTGSPATPGLDFVGEIVKPATGTELKKGQLVFGVAGTSPLAGGGMAEYAVVQKIYAVPVPAGVAPIDACTFGVAALTAYQSVVPRVKRGDRVFINAGSGGTGIFGIQFAKMLGCHVTTTCSGPNVEFCKSLGADEVIDYRKGGIVEALLASPGGQFDHAVDNAGKDKELVWRSHEYMKPGAAYVQVAGEPSVSNLLDTIKMKMQPKFLGGIKGKIEGFWPTPKPEDLQQVAAWVAEGKVKPVVDQKFAFEEGNKAMAKLKTSRARGKIVIDVALDTYKPTGV